MPPGAGSAVGASAGALVGSGAEELINLATPLWERRARNVDRMVLTAEDEAQIPAPELLRAASGDPRLLELLAQAADAAARSFDDWKIDTLARVFVQGARGEEHVDAAQIVLDVVRQLERPHLRLMQLLLSPNPNWNYPENDDNTAATHRWPTGDIIQADSGLDKALDALMGKLIGPGLAYDTAVGAFVGYEATWALTPFGNECAAYLTSRAGDEQAG